MPIGYEVNASIFNTKVAEAVLAMRSALSKVEGIAAWLTNNPVVDGVDPLVADFGYTADEAYAARIYFETVDGIRVNNTNITAIGRKMTGLE